MQFSFNGALYFVAVQIYPLKLDKNEGIWMIKNTKYLSWSPLSETVFFTSLLGSRVGQNLLFLAYVINLTL